MGLGIIGKIMQDNEKQHTYSAGEDKNADENPGYTQWRNDNKKMDDNQQTLNQFKKFKENEKSNALESDSMLNMNSPLHAATTTPTRGNYENPAFISQGNALNIGAKQLLDTSTQSFIDNLPSDEEKAKNKADRLGRRADRMDKRAVKKEKRVNKRVDKRDIRNMGNPGTGDSTDPSYAKINPYAPNDKVKAYNAKSERLRNEAGDKRSNLEARSDKVQMKANASQLVADNLKKIRLGNTSGNMFSFKNQSFQAPKITYKPFENLRIGLTNKKTKK
jgi:hypothetical protein